MTINETAFAKNAEMWRLVTQRLNKLAKDIADSIAAHGLTASGATARSLKVVDEDDGVALYGRNFFPALETGSSRWTGATGIKCSVEEFKAIIRAWATAKGLNFGQASEHERTIEAITYKIIREGTKQKRSGERLDVYTTLLDEAVKDCGDIVAEQMGNQIINYLQQWS